MFQATQLKNGVTNIIYHDGNVILKNIRIWNGKAFNINFIDTIYLLLIFTNFFQKIGIIQNVSLYNKKNISNICQNIFKKLLTKVKKRGIIHLQTNRKMFLQRPFNNNRIYR